MNKKSNIVVPVDLISETGVIHKRNVSYVTNGYTLFFNAQHLLIQLSAKERGFFDYLCEVMRTTDNDVFIDMHLKSDFITQIIKITSSRIKPTKNATGKYVQKLEKLGLILPTQDKSRYIVNPKYVYKGNSGARLNCLKMLIKNRIKAGLSIQPLINEPESAFLHSKPDEKKWSGVSPAP